MTEPNNDELAEAILKHEELDPSEKRLLTIMTNAMKQYKGKVSSKGLHDDIRDLLKKRQEQNDARRGRTSESEVVSGNT
jgi:hypothetical protein